MVSTINGHVVGESNVEPLGGSTNAFLYEGGAMQNLGSLGSHGSAAYAINNSDQIVGQTSTAQNQQHAFLYENSVMRDLGTLGGTYSLAYAINSSGIVVGYSTLPGDQTADAFLYDGTVMRDLGNAGGTSSIGTGINDSGIVVGYFFLDPSDTRGFVYDGTWTYDLNTLLDSTGVGWTVQQASGINNNGAIAATATNPQGASHAVILTPHHLLHPPILPTTRKPGH